MALIDDILQAASVGETTDWEFKSARGGFPGSFWETNSTGAKLLAIQIPRAKHSQRPVHLGRNPFGRAYRRRHDGDYRCTDAEVPRMLVNADETPPRTTHEAPV